MTRKKKIFCQSHTTTLLLNVPRTMPTDPAALQRPPRRRPEEEEEEEEEDEDFFRGAEETASLALFRPKVLGGGGLGRELRKKLFCIDENVGSTFPPHHWFSRRLPAPHLKTHLTRKGEKNFPRIRTVPPPVRLFSSRRRRRREAGGSSRFSVGLRYRCKKWEIFIASTENTSFDPPSRM